MEFLPTLELGLLNGWIILDILNLKLAVAIAALPKLVGKRLYDRSGIAIFAC